MNNHEIRIMAPVVLCVAALFLYQIRQQLKRLGTEGVLHQSEANYGRINHLVSLGRNTLIFEFFKGETMNTLQKLKFKRYIPLLTLLISPWSNADNLQIVGMNMGAAIHGINLKDQCKHDKFGQDNDLTIIGLRRYFGSLAVSAHEYLAN